MNTAQLVPTLVSSEHDSDGRLVALDYESAPPPRAPAGDPWLIAVDSSDNALRAVAQAARQAAGMRACRLHLIHVQPWLSKEAADSELAPRALGCTARARATLDAAGLPWRLHISLGEPAHCIIEHARQLNVAGIVIGSRGLNALEGLLLGSVAYKVMHLSPVPVMVVP